MNILDIIPEGLKMFGYDGLVCPGICGCEIGDLSPGNCFTEYCQPAYQYYHSEIPSLWVMCSKKREHSDEEIMEIIESI